MKNIKINSISTFDFIYIDILVYKSEFTGFSFIYQGFWSQIMLDISYIMGFIGVAVGLIIGILIYSEVEAAIDCPDATTNADGNEACTRAKQIAWTVISILPISMFFALFAIFGGFSRMG